MFHEHSRASVDAIYKQLSRNDAGGGYEAQKLVFKTNAFIESSFTCAKQTMTKSFWQK